MRNSASTKNVFLSQAVVPARGCLEISATTGGVIGALPLTLVSVGIGAGLGAGVGAISNILE